MSRGMASAVFVSAALSLVAAVLTMRLKTRGNFSTIHGSNKLPTRMDGKNKPLRCPDKFTLFLAGSSQWGSVPTCKTRCGKTCADHQTEFKEFVELKPSPAVGAPTTEGCRNDIFGRATRVRHECIFKFTPQAEERRTENKRMIGQKAFKTNIRFWLDEGSNDHDTCQCDLCRAAKYIFATTHNEFLSWKDDCHDDECWRMIGRQRSDGTFEREGEKITQTWTGFVLAMKTRQGFPWDKMLSGLERQQFDGCEKSPFDYVRHGLVELLDTYET